jgi:hypothetical protein
LDENSSTRVYRPGLVLPLVVVLASVGIVYLTTGPHQLRDAWIFLPLWVLFSLPVIIRRRRAIILTPAALCYRPAWGKTLEVPLSGIKRVSLIEPEREGEVRTLRFELLVSGEFYFPLDVRNSDEIVERVRAAVEAEAR